MSAANTAQPEGPSSHPQAATLEFRNVSKTYEGSAAPAIQDLTFEVPAGDICVLVGPSGCGKTTAMRLVNRMIEMTSGDILLDGARVRKRDPRRAAPRDRLRDPADRAVPAPDGRREHRDGARGCSAGTRERIRARVDELLELVGLDPPRPRPLPRAALRRPAPARRRRPRAGRRPAGDAHGRAVRRHRPDQPRAPAGRVPAPPARDPQDDRLRHPRHRRGDQDRRPHRDPARGRRPGPVRHARGAAVAPPTTSSRTSSAPTAPSSAWR